MKLTRLTKIFGSLSPLFQHFYQQTDQGRKSGIAQVEGILLILMDFTRKNQA